MNYRTKVKTRGSLIALAIMIVFSVLFFVAKINFRVNYVNIGERMMTMGFGAYIGLLIILTLFSVAMAIICRIHRIQWPHLLVILIDAVSIAASVLHYFSLDELDFVELVIVGFVLIAFLGLFYCYGMYYVFKWVGNVHDLDDESPYEAQQRQERERPRFGDEGFDYEEFDALVERSAKHLMETKSKNQKK